MKQISVVILNWNGINLLKEYLQRVLDATDLELSEVIVADNGSTDGSLDYLHWLGVPTIEFSENHGFAGGYNLALEQIETPYTILLNSDVAPRPGWDRTLFEYMESHSRCGACQPKVLSWHNPSKFEYAGAAGGFLDRNGYPYCRGRIFGTVETDSGQYQEPIECDWATGAALMIRTELYREAGGLDASFFAHMEEIDLCWRLRLMGWGIAAVPAAEVMHLGGGSLPMGNPRKTYLNFRNNLLLLHKNLPAAERGNALNRRRLLDTIAWAKSVLTLNLADAKAILKAHRDYRQMAPQAKSANAEHNLIKARPNILVEYFLKGKKTFAKLGKVIKNT
ncbi:MAG: glycosyltransferase family 2 protein [Bacteroides sp.]|nr:glycosyltransferase family 2 protein [Bacteroides sp.]MCM1379324.1 glycosyltransferase family 2 protein [Bacteroides sp.]MCM1445017.1 glycosyltransferase family 2 protein [Prevotella sp.]